MVSDRPKPWDLFFVFEVHYDGWFEFTPLRYENGLVYSWAIRKDNLLELAEVRKLLKKRTNSDIVHEIFFRIPQCELDVGLKQVKTEQDLVAMYEYARRYGLIHVYITHGPQDELPLYTDENGIYGSEDEIISRKPRGFKHAGNMSVEELVSWAEEEAASTSVLDKGQGAAKSVKGIADKGKGIMLDERKASRKSGRTRNIGIVIQDNVSQAIGVDDSSDSDVEMVQMFQGSTNTEAMHTDFSDTESEYSDKSVDYLSECEDELISLRKRNTEAKKNPKESDINVSPQDAGCSRPNREYDAGVTNTVIEHEEYMDILMHQLRGKGDGLTDPFTLVRNDECIDKYPIHDDQTHWKMKKPKVGEKYVDAGQLKKCLTYYALANGFSLWFSRSSTSSIIARCGRRPEKLKDSTKGKQRKHNKYPTSDISEGSKCPFRCYGRLMSTESSFQVISLNEEHTCVRNFKYGNLVNFKWIASHFGHKIRQNPEIKLHEIADLVMKKYKCSVTPNQCRHAKSRALNEAEHTIQEHYAMIRSYGKAILDSNDGSTVKLGVTVNPDNKTYFDRFYCCFHGLKKGFQLGCRPVIALDGCFLKKPNVGEILTAVGRDGNNHIFPIAWAIVNVENKDNWSWFLELVGEDIGMPTGNGLTLMSDQHKGLIEAVKDVMPLAEHRQCARHIYEGFRKHYSGVEFRQLFWAASKASYPQLFNKIMQKIKRANPSAHEYLMKKDPKSWSRAFFRIGSNCEAVENGFSECFNSVLLSVRGKPLITMLESMRVIVMERLNTMRQMQAKWPGDLCPNIQKILELNKDKHRFWHVIPSGGDIFEVRNGSDAFKVDELHRTCTCRMWQLSGLPCPHSIAVIFKLNKTPEDYVPPCFRKDNYLKAYNQYMTPVGGMTFWPDSSMYSTVLPPKPRKMPGRPRKQRIRAPHERQFPNRLSKAGVQMTCQNCLEKGHNKASCKNPTIIPNNPKPATRGRGRPKNVANPSMVDEQPSVNPGANTNVVEEQPFVHIQPETPIIQGENDDNVVNTVVGNDTNVQPVMDFVDVRVEGEISHGTNVGTGTGRGRGRGRGRSGGDTGAGTNVDSGRGRGRGRASGRGRATSFSLGVRKVTSDGLPAARKCASSSIGRGRAGRSVAEKYGNLARWFGIGEEAHKDPTPLTQQSQVGASTNIRPRSARIMKRMQSTTMDGIESSSANNQD